MERGSRGRFRLVKIQKLINCDKKIHQLIRSKVAVLVYKVLHGCAPSYLGPCTYVADLPTRRGLRSSCSDCLVQPPVHHSTVGMQPSIFGCWLPCVELPAAGGYVGAISDNLPHSTQNVSVHLSHILAFGSFDMFVSTHCLQWTYQCFKCFWPLSKIKKFMID